MRRAGWLRPVGSGIRGLDGGTRGDRARKTWAAPGTLTVLSFLSLFCARPFPDPYLSLSPWAEGSSLHSTGLPLSHRITT